MGPESPGRIRCSALKMEGDWHSVADMTEMRKDLAVFDSDFTHIFSDHTRFVRERSLRNSEAPSKV